jgi:hypothetical protein
MRPKHAQWRAHAPRVRSERSSERHVSRDPEISEDSMRSRIRVLAMVGSVIYAAELLSDRSVIIYRDGVYVDEGNFAEGRLRLHDEFVPARAHAEMEMKLTRALTLGPGGLSGAEV